MNRVTAVIAAYNESSNIKECIDSLGFCDEIVVADSFSPDGTGGIAAAMGARVINVKENFPEHKKNAAIREALNPWVLVVDSDERVTPELRDEIISTLKDPGCDGYWIYRKNFFLGKEIRHCGWDRDRVLRLFRKESGRYPDKLVHGELEFDGRRGVLMGKLEHHPYRVTGDYLRKAGLYTLWAAYEHRGKAGPAKVIFSPVFRVIKMYFFRLGFLDGVHGFALCFTVSFSVFLKYLRIYLKGTPADETLTARGGL